MKKNIKIVKSEPAESAELLAQSIIQISDGFSKAMNSPLSQRALIVLLHDGIGTAKISKSQIQLVLENLPRLKAWYIKR